MSDDQQQPEGAQEAQQDTPQNDTPASSKSYDEAYVKKLRAEAAEWRTKARAGEDAQRKLAELNERELSDAQKAAKRAEEFEARATRAETDLIRYRVAAEKGVPAGLVGRLQGSTEEEIAADADALLELFPQRESSVPKPNPAQGARSGSGPSTPQDRLGDFLDSHFSGTR